MEALRASGTVPVREMIRGTLDAVVRYQREAPAKLSSAPR